MAKGSQLKQLKSALDQAGLSHQPQAGKKRKRAAPTERDKERKAERLKQIQQKLNPFDVKVTKLKHDVGGRKIIGTTGRPAQSKQAGIEQVRIHVLLLIGLRQLRRTMHRLYLQITEEENSAQRVRGEGPFRRHRRPPVR